MPTFCHIFSFLKKFLKIYSFTIFCHILTWFDVFSHLSTHLFRFLFIRKLIISLHFWCMEPFKYYVTLWWWGMGDNSDKNLNLSVFQLFTLLWIVILRLNSNLTVLLSFKFYNSSSLLMFIAYFAAKSYLSNKSDSFYSFLQQSWLLNHQKLICCRYAKFNSFFLISWSCIWDSFQCWSKETASNLCCWKLVLNDYHFKRQDFFQKSDFLITENLLLILVKREVLYGKNFIS